MKKTTVDLSGFGGGYEALCQTMLWRGVLHLAEVKPSPEMWSGATEYKNIYGIFVVDGAELKALEASIMKPPADGCTGAMHQAVMHSLRTIHKLGVDGWIALYRAKAPDRIYEAEVTL